MKQEALGMIETRGLVPAIEAGDAGVKAANVKLLGYELVKGGLVMVAFTGEVAAVKASVEAGSAAAARVGQVISEHVIPRLTTEATPILTPKIVKAERKGLARIPCPAI
jgi:ethanolamine utilization protein EutM